MVVNVIVNVTYLTGSGTAGRMPASRKEAGMNATGPRLSSVSAFFPCYNDSNTIAGLVGMVEFALRQITDDLKTFVGGHPQHDDITLIAIRKL